MRTITPQELCHERLGDDFASALSEYDTLRRLETLVDEFLGAQDLHGLRALDVGCGLGYFSERLTQRGADVVACDLGESLVQRTVDRVGCQGVQADCLRLEDEFGPECFDVVLSSECIEHTPDPYESVRQMTRLLRPGGWLALSTPNVVWWPVVKCATVLRLRPFDGLENFSTWGGLRRTLRESGVSVVRERGLHLFPFQLGMHGLSRWCDARCQMLRGVMINICLLGRKDVTG